MVRSVSVKLKYTPDDSLRVAKYIRNQSFVYRNDILLTSGFVFVAFIILIVLMADDFSTFRIVGALVFSLIPAAAVAAAVFILHRALNPWLMRRTIVKYFESSPIAKEEIVVTFSDEGVATESDLTSSRNSWQSFIKVEESAEDILFYCGHKLSWFLPKSAFGSDNDLTSLRSLLRRSLKDRVYLLDT